jgi:hypothetical protein
MRYCFGSFELAAEEADNWAYPSGDSLVFLFVADIFEPFLICPVLPETFKGFFFPRREALGERLGLFR